MGFALFVFNLLAAVYATATGLLGVFAGHPVYWSAVGLGAINAYIAYRMRGHVRW